MIANPDLPVVVHETCRVCPQARLVPLFDLGALHLSAFPAAAEDLDPYPRVPLRLMGCPRCQLVQLQHTTPFPWLFNADYGYRSGVNEAMIAELHDVVRGALRALGGHAKAEELIALDIGANDGTLLGAYPPGVLRVAVEPSPAWHRELEAQAHYVVAEAFPVVDPSPGTARLLATLHGKVGVITAIAMAYDLEDPLAFFRAARELLAPEGVMVVQFQDLLGMLEQTAFDCVCHEHLEYYSVWALAGIAAQAGLKVVDVEGRAVNGGSLRVTLRHLGRHTWPEERDGIDRVVRQLQREQDAGLTMTSGVEAAFGAFRWRVGVAAQQIHGTVREILDQGGTIDLYGASTKGNTLLQVVGLGAGEIRQALERTPQKWGRFVGRTGIPIVPEEVGRRDPATVWLVPVWQFRDGILVREAEYLARGGRMVFPLPTVEIVQGAAV